MNWDAIEAIGEVAGAVGEGVERAAPRARAWRKSQSAAGTRAAIGRDTHRTGIPDG